MEGLGIDISGLPPVDASGRPDRSMSVLLLERDPPLNDLGRARLAEVMRGAAKRKADGWGFPSMMSSPAALQFVVTPQETLIINMYRDLRHVYTDGRGHPDAGDLWPTPWGDSVGHWEGNTLVIDTIAVQDPHELFFAPPLTAAARYVERLRKRDADHIELTMTVEDPMVLTRPWEFRVTYSRLPGVDRLVHNAADNDRDQVEGEALTIMPPGE